MSQKYLVKNNIIVFSLTVLGKTNRKISAAVTNQSLFDIDSLNFERFVVTKPKMKIGAVK